MADVLVLGAGRIGSVIAADLARDDTIDVMIADRSADALTRAEDRSGGTVTAYETDLADPHNIAEIVKRHDMVVGALASSIGMQTLDAVIRAGRPYCDISFMPENPLTLHDQAQRAGVTAVVDCGVAPGLSNLTAAHGVRLLDRATHIDMYVGGLPKVRRWPFEYAAGFSPDDVIEEYTRPARLVEHGEVVTREALTEPELIDFDGVGTLEAFNTDGLRSLIDTLDVPNMKEKTLRYPGHIELMRVLRHMGLFDRETVDIAGDGISPLALTSALLKKQWRMEPGDADITVLRVIVRGERNGAPTRVEWNLVDEYDAATDTTSMGRTTAFPCAIVTRAILDGTIRDHGVVAPEHLATIDGFFDRMVNELARRGVYYGRHDS